MVNFRLDDQGLKIRELEGDQELINDILVVGNKIAEESSITLIDLIEKFCHSKITEGKWKGRTPTGNTGMLYVIRDFLEYAVESALR